MNRGEGKIIYFKGSLWRKSGRWDAMGEELVKFEDRHKRELVLRCEQHTVILTVKEISECATK
jgi:prolyl-tRNA synthetase